MGLGIVYAHLEAESIGPNERQESMETKQTAGVLVIPEAGIFPFIIKGDTLGPLQSLVGGRSGLVTLVSGCTAPVNGAPHPDGAQFDVWVNDEGILEEAEVNPLASIVNREFHKLDGLPTEYLDALHPTVGDAAFLSSDDSGATVSLDSMVLNWLTRSEAFADHVIWPNDDDSYWAPDVLVRFIEQTREAVSAVEAGTMTLDEAAAAMSQPVRIG